MSKVHGSIKDFNSFQYIKWFFYLIGLASVIWLGFYAYGQVDLYENTVLIQTLCVLFSLLWLIANSRQVFISLTQIKFSELRIHPAWLLVLAAIVLRCYALTIFPPVNQTGFEEVQTGSAAYKILLGLGLPIEFRFTGLLGALGLAIGSESSLASLRFPFQVVGGIGLILLVYSLRSLKVSWIPTLIMVFIAATLRFLVIASAVADELFVSISTLIAFVLCIIRSENTKQNRSFWLALAGIIGGILMFEYTSYRLPVGMFGLWLFWKCIYGYEGGGDNKKASSWSGLFSFFIPLVVMALPTFVQTIHSPQGSIFFEAFLRHGVERSSIFSEQFVFDLKSQTLSLIGWPAPVSGYYAPLDKPVILPPVGWLFGISCLFGLLFMGRGTPRVLALTVLLMLFSSSVFANDLNIGRMSPTLPLLLILSGLFLEKVYQILIRFAKWLLPEKTISSLHSDHAEVEYGAAVLKAQDVRRLMIKILTSMLFLFLILEITLVNLVSLREMPANFSVINEYINDDYSVCSYIGTFAKPKQRVYIFSPTGSDICSAVPSEGWYFGDKQLEIHHISGELVPDDFVPGDFIVMGVINRTLTREELSQMINFGTAADSLVSLRFSRNIAGRITAASICFQCEGSE